MSSMPMVNLDNIDKDFPEDDLDGYKKFEPETSNLKGDELEAGHSKNTRPDTDS